MRRDIRRANTAMAVVLIAVLAFALLAVFAGLRAERNRRRAEAAESENQERLRLAYTEEARAIRLSAEAGGRAAAMNAISNAVAIRISPELRTEAIACLALADLVPEGSRVPTPKELPRWLVDPQLRHYAYMDAAGQIHINGLVPGLASLVLDPRTAGCLASRPDAELDFSPDGTRVAASLADGTVAAWNLATQMPVFTNHLGTNSGFIPTFLRGLAFTADSQGLIFSDPGAGGQISIYNVATGQREQSGIPVWGRSFRLRPDFRMAAVATETGVDLVEYPGGIRGQSLILGTSVVTMEWSPDGRQLAVACPDGTIRLLEPETGRQSLLTGHSEACVTLGYNAAGTSFFSTSRDGTTRLWDATTGRIMAVGQGFGCSFSSDGEELAYWQPWVGFGIWRVVASQVFTWHDCDKHAGPLISLDLSPSGRWCVVTQSKGFRLWNLAAGDQETFVAANATGVRMGLDERSLFVCNSNGLAIWPVTTNAAGVPECNGAAARQIPLPDGLGARAVALSGNGQWALVELRDRRLARIDLTGGQPATLLQGRWGEYNLKGPASPTGAGRFAISPDGQWVATGFDFGGEGPKVWNGATGGLVMNLPAESSVVAFSADGRWLGLASVSVNSVWSTGDWQLQRNWRRDDLSLVHGTLAFLPAGPLMAVSQTRQNIQLRNWQQDALVADLPAPGVQSINSIRAATNGDILVMATASDMMEVWRLGELRHELAAMHLDWGGPDAAGPTAIPAGGGGSAGRNLVTAILAGFALVTTVALLTLHRHRRAIERFVIAEAHAAQSHRELDVAKIELMHSQKMQALGTLAAGVAHDFNNLLSVIRMSNKLIGRKQPADTEIQALVADVEQAVLQGKTVVGSVLGFARRGRETGEPLDVSAVVEETVSLLSREFLSGIALTLELERGTRRVQLARGPLEQVVMNLLVNASEAMQGTGRLDIRLHSRSDLPAGAYVLRPRPADQYLELNVQDAGPGIAPEIRDRLFEPFFTTKSTGVKPGTGLGLSLVYSIARQAGLGLTLSSEPGQGARFTVFLPTVPATVRETHSVQTPRPD